MDKNEIADVRSRFDREAAAWDNNPVRVVLALAVVEAILKEVAPRPDMDAVDFGAGTGLVTLGLSPHVRSLTAVDASGEMLRELSRKLQVLGIANVRTLNCDIAVAGLPGSAFDLIVSSMVLHHIKDVPQVLRKLRPSLRTGGWIALADLDSEDGSFHPDPTGVFHHGFDREEVRQWLKDAGFTDTAARQAHLLAKPGADGAMRQYPVFLVTGRAD